MSLRVTTALLLSCSVACGDSERPADEFEPTLRVASYFGLGDFRPGFRTTGASASALELGYDDFESHGTLKGRDGRVVRIGLHGGHSDEALSRAFSMSAVESVAVPRARELLVTFDTEDNAQRYAERPSLAGWRLGPYRGERAEGVLRLRRIHGDGVGLIDFVPMSETEQWRRLLARDVDVIPVASSLHEARFAGVGEVRVLRYASLSGVLLIFNSELLPLAQRAAVAAAVDHAAIRALLCEDCPALEEDTTAEAGDLPDSLRVLTVEGADVLMVVARSLRLQLMEQGSEVTIHAASVEETLARLADGEFEAVLMPRTIEQGWLGQVVANTAAVSRFDTKPITQATGGAGIAELQRVVWTELPLIPIASFRNIAVVGAGWCGGAPTRVQDWKWLAELYPCEEAQ